MGEPPPSYDTVQQLPNSVPEQAFNLGAPHPAGMPLSGPPGIPLVGPSVPGYSFKPQSQPYQGAHQGCQCQCCPHGHGYGNFQGGYGQMSQPIGIQPHIQSQPIPQATYITQFGPEPITLVCPHCQKRVLTQTEHKMGALSWIMCMEMGLCWLLCDAGKDVEHRCPNCNNFLGFFKRM